ncbi:hypothetical protein HOU02_gp181 [Caulobacter phage CcrBL9]|uniref:Uncharacterized protein n=1 Tax=Caulobacter phage CcrBL9 TaxID=2283270 RepID=A0A385ECD4_9CAUD|nr:hypothetical protein HOU02_gp004 [Caulobacter phage CcrBL9]YP_009810174.1 hypothetical protein HOU02_gp181 [Caulobacter phage CcrBL9]AXQ69028.1 hypothetical protein CcrBL9_gp004 [Caulobacter phage CcrBL9]AXQ69544.1 hypothetical protein CcrBL9_gp520 [Caulobacter phage CcrBL9]
MTEQTLDLLYPALMLEQKIPHREGMLRLAIVLRDFGPKAPHRYVTHLRIENPVPGSEHAFTYSYDHGTYSADLRRATTVYFERVAERVMTAMVALHDLPEVAPPPPTVTMPLELAQTAYGLIDDNELDLSKACGNVTLVEAAITGLAGVLGSLKYFRDVEEGNAKLLEAYEAAQAARDAALEAESEAEEA